MGHLPVVPGAWLTISPTKERENGKKWCEIIIKFREQDLLVRGLGNLDIFILYLSVQHVLITSPSHPSYGSVPHPFSTPSFSLPLPGLHSLKNILRIRSLTVQTVKSLKVSSNKEQYLNATRPGSWKPGYRLRRGNEERTGTSP